MRAGCCGAFERSPALTISIDVAAFEPGESEAALIGRADAALYASKAQGRNRVTVAEGESLQDVSPA